MDFRAEAEKRWVYHLIYYALNDLGYIKIKQMNGNIYIYTPNEYCGKTTVNVIGTDYISVAQVRHMINYIRFELSQVGKNEL